MSRNLSHALWACPPYWNTVSLHPTVVDHCTISYGTGRVVGTVSYTRTSTVRVYVTVPTNSTGTVTYSTMIERS